MRAVVEPTDEGLKERLSRQGEEALGKLAEELVANPVVNSALMAAVRQVSTSRPQSITLFNTHWHPEQTGLNEQIGKAGKTIIAQENTRLWLTTDVRYPWNGQAFTRLPKPEESSGAAIARAAPASSPSRAAAPSPGMRYSLRANSVGASVAGTLISRRGCARLAGS